MPLPVPPVTACHPLPQVEHGGAKRGESTSCRLRSTVCGPLSGIASRLVAARSDIW